MAITHSVKRDDQPQVFKTFPEFSKLTLADRSKYERLIADYPPVSDVQFATLMVWWNWLGTCAVSLLNDNLVISYWFPGGEEQSGLAIVGTNKIDESICAIFDHLGDKGDRIRLTHVPDFVLPQIQYPELFVFKAEHDFSEYVYDISRFYPLNRLISYRRLRVRNFLSQIGEERILIKSLDLSKTANQRVLLDHDWPNKGINKLPQLEDEAAVLATEHASFLGLENLCLYIDGTLRGYCLYHQPADKRYVILKHARVDYEIPRTLDYMLYAFAAWYADQGIRYVNLDSDMGLPFLRMFKLALGPSNFFRKYTVEPSR